ncbi:hypothetical protein LSTR_LSTR015101 [Laodelphax striatellus]|uniref:Uncharacterized protein n=1 Tax=Laodelphax striatellus TaxID=195883 RepID=A0A482WWS8_LAOST|nr:hypothetical protein LSTR_LSTR015101 [Laodelphax striatellus]
MGRVWNLFGSRGSSVADEVTSFPSPSTTTPVTSSSPPVTSPSVTSPSVTSGTATGLQNRISSVWNGLAPNSNPTSTFVSGWLTKIMTSYSSCTQEGANCNPNCTLNALKQMIDVACFLMKTFS